MATLRGRVTAAAVAAVVLVVFVLAGLLVVVLERDQRAGADLVLRRRADLYGAVLDRTGAAALPRLADLPLGDGEAVRLLRDRAVVAEAGAAAPVGDGGEGFATVRAGDATWRVLTVPVAGDTLSLQVARPLPDQLPGRPTIRRRVFGLTVLSLGAAGVLASLLTGVALRPLRALGAAAARVGQTSDLTVRVPQGQGVAEVDEVAGSFNTMLARLEQSRAQVTAALEASRRFAADAGHELRSPLTALQANLDVLRRNPGLDGQQRREVLAELDREHARLAALLDALQALARGDASETVPREPVDLAELLDEAVERLRAAHPGLTVELDAPQEPVTVAGWAAGLRLLADNLLANAVRHGAGERGTVAVAVAPTAGGAVLSVDDDGPGIPLVEREHVFRRFARGSMARADGSGLGLALVAQQAALHGGTVTVDDGPRGGARFTVRLPH